MEKRARVIAYYLPQYHPIPQNDHYWGKGFTEWTNVAKSRPLFRGHMQPRVPADLGFYDLRLDEVRQAQADLAREAGIEGFCYWHYWFGDGEEVLEMPFNRLIETGKPDFPFCLGWANHDWTTKTWEKGKSKTVDTMIFKQKYLGAADNEKHFYRLLPAFRDPRYIKVDGKLLFVLFSPLLLENIEGFMAQWNELAKANGLEGFHFVANAHTLPDHMSLKNMRSLDEEVKKKVDRYLDFGVDAVTTVNLKRAEIRTGGRLKKVFYGALRRLKRMPAVEKYDFSRVMRNYYSPLDEQENVYPMMLAGWDRSPRSGGKAVVYYGDTPAAFREAAEMAVRRVEHKDPEHRIVFLNSWNEWGEGAYMEPDLRYGRAKLDALKEVLEENEG